MPVVINEFEVVPESASVPGAAPRPESATPPASGPEKAAELVRLLQRDLERQRRVRVY